MIDKMQRASLDDQHPHTPPVAWARRGAERDSEAFDLQRIRTSFGSAKSRPAHQRNASSHRVRISPTWDVPHAVIRVPESYREQLERNGKIPIRLQFVGLARRCQGWRVVLYQSARQAGPSGETVGYFATAVVKAVLVLEGTGLHAELLVADMRPLEKPQPMLVQDGFGEASLRTLSGQFNGWLAAEDVREITAEQYRKLAEDDQALFAGFPDVDLPVPRFQTHRRQIRDPQLRGACVSGLWWEMRDQWCFSPLSQWKIGLVAAHILARRADRASKIGKDAALTFFVAHYSRFRRQGASGPSAENPLRTANGPG